MVNELAIVCHELGIDIWDTIRCASSKPFGFHTFYPGPGPGGHCIPIDPVYLSKYVFKNLNKNFELINLSQKINSNMPFYVVSRAKSLLKQSNKEIKGSKILIVGASYKSDISDTRESPILGVIKYLMENKGNFIIYDSHVFDLKVDSKIFKVEKELPQNLAEFDLILILQHHSDLDVKKIVSSGVTILDTRGKIKEAQKL
jgi:nucleotide sugar dehydrogenase